MTSDLEADMDACLDSYLDAVLEAVSDDHDDLVGVGVTDLLVDCEDRIDGCCGGCEDVRLGSRPENRVSASVLECEDNVVVSLAVLLVVG